MKYICYLLLFLTGQKLQIKPIEKTFEGCPKYNAVVNDWVFGFFHNKNDLYESLSRYIFFTQIDWMKIFRVVYVVIIIAACIRILFIYFKIIAPCLCIVIML